MMPRLTLFLVLGALPVIVLAFVQGLMGWSTRTRQTLATLLSGKGAEPCPVCNQSEKPPVLMAAVPAWSHTEKMVTIAEGLVNLGYPVTFMANDPCKQTVERVGAKYVQLEGHQSEMLAPEDAEMWVGLNDDEEKEGFAINATF